MSSNRASRHLIAVAASAVCLLVGSCAQGAGSTADDAAASSPSRTAARPLTGAQLAAALPTQGALPGYKVTNTPETKVGGNKPDLSVRPAACQPLQGARSGRSAASVASASVNISDHTFAPPEETLTFTSYRPGEAGAYLTSLNTALDACPSLSLLTLYGERLSRNVERVKDQVSVGDASVSYRTHFTSTVDGFKGEMFSLITIVRSGNATITVVTDSSVGSQLPEAKKRAFVPKLDQQLLKREAAALAAAQHR